MLYSPLEQFSIVSLLSYNLPGTNLSFFVFSNFILMLFFTALIFSVVFLISVKKHNKVFTPFLIVFNNYYSFVITIIRENFIKKGFFFFPYLLSFLTFFCGVALGFQKHGVHFFSLFLPNGAPFLLAPFLIAVEIISYVARLFSLAIRLFANIMSGHTLLKILAGFGWVLIVYTTSLLGIVPVLVVFVITGLEIVIAFLQAYVFTVLSSIYINEALQLH
jgi:F0F1-type ATP synthase membrane subunit a